MIFFTNFISDMNLQFTLGWCPLIVLFVNITINMTTVILSSLKLCYLIYIKYYRRIKRYFQRKFPKQEKEEKKEKENKKDKEEEENI